MYRVQKMNEFKKFIFFNQIQFEFYKLPVWYVNQLPTAVLFDGYS